ncbi:MAG: hypothetical protein WCC50_16125 [Pseudolabrys sp.]
MRGFLRAFTKALRETVGRPPAAIETVLKRNTQARKSVELERLNMAIRENIVTPEVKANGYGDIDRDRFARAIEQIALAYKFKAPKPKPEDVFDSSFLPLLADRKYR